MFCYDDNEKPFRGRITPYADQDANRYWLQHYSNAKFLTFLLKNSTDAQEKIQASKELTLADKKMKHWRNHINFDLSHVTKETKKIDQQWEK